MARKRGLARRDVMAGREHGEARHLGQDLPGERVEQVQRFHLVVEQLDADRGLRVFRREDVDDVAAHAEHAALELDVVAVVLHLRQPRDDVALAHLLVLAQQQDHAVVVGRVADTVDRRHGATITVSRRSSSDLVADSRICSMCSLMLESFSMNRSRAGT